MRRRRRKRSRTGQGMTFDASDDDVMMEMSVYGN